MSEDKRQAGREEALAISLLDEKREQRRKDLADQPIVSGDTRRVDEYLVHDVVRVIRSMLRRHNADNNTRVTCAVTFLLTEIVEIEKEAGERIDGDALFDKLKGQLEIVRKDMA